MKMRHKSPIALTPVALAIAASLHPGRAAADVGPFEELCGTILTADTKIKDTNEIIDSSCNINTDGFKLDLEHVTVTGHDSNLIIMGETGDITIRDSSFTATSDADIEIRNMTGNVTIKGSRFSGEGGAISFETTSGNITITDTSDDISKFDTDGFITIKTTDGGNITIKGNSDISADGGSGRIRVETTDGGAITIRDSVFALYASNTINIKTKEGDIAVLDNELLLPNQGELKINTDSGQVDVKGNEINTDQKELEITTDSGQVHVKGNEINTTDEGNLHITTVSGPVEFVENTGNISGSLNVTTTSADIAVVRNDVLDVELSLGIGSTSGDINVVDNNFVENMGFDSEIHTDSGVCETKGNTPTLTCE